MVDRIVVYPFQSQFVSTIQGGAGFRNHGTLTALTGRHDGSSKAAATRLVLERVVDDRSFPTLEHIMIFATKRIEMNWTSTTDDFCSTPNLFGEPWFLQSFHCWFELSNSWDYHPCSDVRTRRTCAAVICHIATVWLLRIRHLMIKSAAIPTRFSNLCECCPPLLPNSNPKN